MALFSQNCIRRYFTHHVYFNTILAKTQKGVGGEIQLTDAISSLLQYEAIFAHKISGTRYDCGSKLGYLKASVGFGLKHPETKDEFKAFIASIL